MTAPLPVALGPLTIAAVWTCYLPLGSKYATVLACAMTALFALWQRRRSNPGPIDPAPTSLAATVLLLWLTVSAAWSPAPGRLILSQLGQYSLPLLVPLIASICPAATARRALGHFAISSAVVALLFALAHLGLLPALPWPLGHTTVDAEGNQRIASSILLALGAGIAANFALQGSRAARTGWLLTAAVCVVGLAWQDRRTGMLLLPLLMLVWGLARQPRWWRRLAITAAIVLVAAGAWQLSDGVRARFAEGLAELRHYPANDTVATSWGQRLRMWELTAAMVVERPLAGHGVGSWRGLWRERVTPGTALAANSTPHSEYLLLAQQGGAVAVALWLWMLLGGLRHALQAGVAGVPALMAWTALAWTGLFNAVLRDAKFALPLLLLTALAMSAARGDPVARGQEW